MVFIYDSVSQASAPSSFNMQRNIGVLLVLVIFVGSSSSGKPAGNEVMQNIQYVLGDIQKDGPEGKIDLRLAVQGWMQTTHPSQQDINKFKTDLSIGNIQDYTKKFTEQEKTAASNALVKLLATFTSEMNYLKQSIAELNKYIDSTKKEINKHDGGQKFQEEALQRDLELKKDDEAKLKAYQAFDEMVRRAYVTSFNIPRKGDGTFQVKSSDGKTHTLKYL